MVILDTCSSCKNKRKCADERCMPLDDFISSSNWIDWTTYSCDEWEKGYK